MSKRFRRRKRRFKGKRSLVLRNRKDIKMLKKGIEFKFIDSSQTNYTATTTPTMVLLNGLRLGVGSGVSSGAGFNLGSRIGRQVQSRRVMIRGFVHNDNVTPLDCIVRIILCKKKDGNSNLATITNLIQNHTAATYNTMSMKNMDHHKDWKIYFDHTFAMDTGLHAYAPFKIIQKLNHTVVFDNGNAGTYEDIEENQLYLVVLSNRGGDNAPLVDWTCRYSFTDA